jgi:ATP-binding cassette subfamily C exporter for protease/lipase
LSQQFWLPNDFAFGAYVMKKIMMPRTELTEVLFSFRKAFYTAGVFSMFINLLGLVPSIYMLQVYDRVLQSRNVTTLIMLTVIMLGFYVMSSMLELARSKLLIRVGAQLDMKLNDRVFVASFERNLKRSGGNAGQAMGDLTNVRQFLTGNGLGTNISDCYFPFQPLAWCFCRCCRPCSFFPCMGNRVVNAQAAG